MKIKLLIIAGIGVALAIISAIIIFKKNLAKFFNSLEFYDRIVTDEDFCIGI